MVKLTLITLISFSLSYSLEATSIRMLKIKRYKEHQSMAQARELPKTLKCEVLIDFMSHASGIDTDVYTSLERWLEYNSKVADGFIWGWGKEGEKSICLLLTKDTSKQELISEIKEAFASKVKRGSMSIKPL